MRLLHTSTFSLVSFTSAHSAPDYAVLSHTWGSDEVLYDDITTPERTVATAVSKPGGWEKVRRACQVAHGLGFDFVWIDTLCIDKSSSAELSEAINSMFEWYALGGVCLAYVADYLDEGRLKEGRGGADGGFLESRWFRRGWTLQELIAPGNLVFYDAEWNVIGDRRFLCGAIASQTAIYRGVLARRNTARSGGEHLKSLRQELTAVCAAAKMKWVAGRQTTRPEDMAYCLLGLFNVNMPLLYGEGSEKAFGRLQEEIIKHCFDQTILAWQSPEGELPEGGGRWDWILSPSPEYFAGSEMVQPLRGQPRSDNGSAHPDGLSLKVLICPVGTLGWGDMALDCLGQTFLVDFPDSIATTKGGFLAFLAILHCCADGNYTKRVALLVFRDKHQQDMYYRAHQGVFVVEIGDTVVRIGQSRQPLNLADASPSQIILCPPPTLSWHSKRGYWPCGYNWKSTHNDWKLVDFLECKPTPDGLLLPKLPAWSRDATQLELTDTVHPYEYKINGILLFEREAEDAFFLIWGAVPLDGIPTFGPWWKSPGGYFCLVVEWEEFTGNLYSRADVGWLIGEWHHEATSFFERLMGFAEKSMMRRRLVAECQVAVGARNREAVVRASVSEQDFLGVDGLVVGVLID